MKTMINIKADTETKENAQAVARELGLPLSSVINAFLKDFIRTRSLAFSAIPTMTPTLARLLGIVEQDIKNEKNISPVFSSTKAANDYLDTL